MGLVQRKLITTLLSNAVEYTPVSGEKWWSRTIQRINLSMHIKIPTHRGCSNQTHTLLPTLNY